MGANIFEVGRDYVLVETAPDEARALDRLGFTLEPQPSIQVFPPADADYPVRSKPTLPASPGGQRPKLVRRVIREIFGKALSDPEPEAPPAGQKDPEP